MLEVLHRSFVGFSSFASPERSKIAAFASPGILLARVQTIFSTLQFSDHAVTPNS